MIIDHSHGFSLDESQSYSKEIKQKGTPKQKPKVDNRAWPMANQHTYIKPGDSGKWINIDDDPRPQNTPLRASANLPPLPSNGPARQLVVNDGEPRPPGK